MNFQRFKLDLEKVEEPEIKLPTSTKNKRVPEKYFCFTDYAKVFDSVNHNKVENSSRDRITRPPDLPP